MSATKVRMISAAILFAILVGITYFFSKKGLLIFSALLCAGAIYEYYKLSFKHTNKLLTSCFAALTYALYYIEIYASHLTSFLFISSSISFILLSLTSFKDSSKSMTAIASALIGFVYVGLLPALFTKLFLFHPKGLYFLSFTLIAVISTDVSAYFVGRAYGKRPLMKEVSPNKTIEGAIAGLIAASVLGYLSAYLFHWQEHAYSFLIVFFLASLFGQFGDLFESLLKRVAGVKDSGKIMPGHGGVLDRIDSLLFASPIFYCYAFYFL